MKIKTEDLLEIIKILSQKLEHSFDKIELSEDYYWEILSDEDLYDPKKDPSEFSLGQLSDDWSELIRLKNNEKPINTQDIKRLAMILRFISHKSPVVW